MREVSGSRKSWILEKSIRTYTDHQLGPNLRKTYILLFWAGLLEHILQLVLAPSVSRNECMPNLCQCSFIAVAI
jgi:hypothetical protein